MHSHSTMARQPRLVNAIAFISLVLTIFFIPETESVRSPRRLELASSVEEIEKGSSFLGIKDNSGPSTSGPGHRAGEAPSQDIPH
ncbi:hypothetical protein PVK06_006711 [Gossypium arboreum]|uniref:Uncharacterized protein n=3 Tax=Gossypium TaxID=3633 RepID=A0ABR0QFA2_GOSAR|nr:hypothetical protein PVK06_006711 [Gossypium arboreum]